MKSKDDKPKNGTTILQCSCEHRFQDKCYGRGVRVHNYMANGTARCTVCSNERAKGTTTVR